MKVKISNYISRWTTSSFENWCLTKIHKKSHWDIDESEYTTLSYFVEGIAGRWQTVLNYTVNVYFDNKKRTEKVHIDKYDTWSMDSTLSIIILPMLKQLKATKHGSPMVDDKDVPKELRSTSAPAVKEWETDDNVHDRWDWVMDEMIWTFEQLVDDDNDSQFHSGVHDVYWEKCEDKPFYSEMKKGPKDTFVYDKVGHQKHSKRIQRGTTLFGKYYRGLWD